MRPSHGCDAGSTPAGDAIVCFKDRRPKDTARGEERGEGDRLTPGQPRSHTSPSSRGQGHDPFKVATRVRIPLGTPKWGGKASRGIQGVRRSTDRMLRYERGDGGSTPSGPTREGFKGRMRSSFHHLAARMRPSQGRNAGSSPVGNARKTVDRGSTEGLRARRPGVQGPEGPPQRSAATTRFPHRLAARIGPFQGYNASSGLAGDARRMNRKAASCRGKV